MSADATGINATPRSQLVTGWGRASPTSATIVRVEDAEGLDRLIADPGSRGVIARGMGRAYGDAAQNAGGRVLDLTSLDTPIAADLERGVVRVAAGVSLDLLMRRLVPNGWFPLVSPGTRYVSVGGAIACDIHGKNHHVDGSLCNHVTDVLLQTPQRRLRISPDDDGELFWATAGGMGLTGVIVEATMRLQRVETSQMRVDTERARDLDEAMALMETGDHEYQYSVAWIDCLARGKVLGRAVLTRAHHARIADLAPRDRRAALSFSPSSRIAVPSWFPGHALNRVTVRMFNELWFRKAPRRSKGRLESLAAFFHPLDAIRHWNRLYGPRGFVQYQFVVPFGAEQVLRSMVEELSRMRCPSFLAVLKRFGAGNPGPLSFPIAGWTLAVDIPAGLGGLGRLLDRFDEVVAETSGRVYLAKDGRLRPELLATMYPRLAAWRETRDRADPHGVMRSDLARRLGLVPTPAPG